MKTYFKTEISPLVARMKFLYSLRSRKWNSKWNLLMPQRSYLAMRWLASRRPSALVNTTLALQLDGTKSCRSWMHASTFCWPWFPTCTLTGLRRTSLAPSSLNCAKVVRLSSHDPKAPLSTTWWMSRKTLKNLQIPSRPNSMPSLSTRSSRWRARLELKKSCSSSTLKPNLNHSKTRQMHRSTTKRFWIVQSMSTWRKSTSQWLSWTLLSKKRLISRLKKGQCQDQTLYFRVELKVASGTLRSWSTSLALEKASAKSRRCRRTMQPWTCSRTFSLAAQHGTLLLSLSHLTKSLCKSCRKWKMLCKSEDCFSR